MTDDFAYLRCVVSCVGADLQVGLLQMLLDSIR